MQVVKKAFAHMGAVIKGMLFIGFTVQILLGLVWMFCNFGQVQDFGEPGSVLYGGLFRLFGGIPQILYLLQLGAAFLAGDFFLKNFRREGASRGGRALFWRFWRGLVLLTYPFAMQCHMAVQPFSLMGSLFLVMVCLLMRISGRRSKGFCWNTAAEGRVVSLGPGIGRAFLGLALAAGCAGGFLLLSGGLDAAGREEPGHSMAAAAASRFAWPTIWYDQGSWTEDLREAVADVLWEASYYPENMELLEAALEERLGAEAAEACYRQMAEVAWRNHASMIIRQMGWDVLGYTVTPVIFQLQMQGEAYDSYTGRNYEIMRDNSPVLTRNYVNYGCWWFGAAFLLALLAAAAERISGDSGHLRGMARPAVICLVCFGLLVGVLTMRGAGIMDYKYTAVISQMWLLPVLFLLGEKEDTWKRHAEAPPGVEAKQTDSDTSAGEESAQAREKSRARDISAGEESAQAREKSRARDISVGEESAQAREKSRARDISAGEESTQAREKSRVRNISAEGESAEKKKTSAAAEPKQEEKGGKGLG